MKEVPEEVQTPPISEFKGRYGFLSNFYPCKFLYKGLEWPSSEHAYQAMKSDDPKVWEKVRVLATAAAAKAYGKKISRRADWTEEIAIQFMDEVVLAKFSQNRNLCMWLVNTEDAHLEEGNHWHDRFWGVFPPVTGEGKNELGKVLMRVREKLCG